MLTGEVIAEVTKNHQRHLSSNPTDKQAVISHAHKIPGAIAQPVNHGNNVS